LRASRGKKQKDGRFCQFEFYPGSSSLLVTPAAVQHLSASTDIINSWLRLRQTETKSIVSPEIYTVKLLRYPHKKDVVVKTEQRIKVEK